MQRVIYILLLSLLSFSVSGQQCLGTQSATLSPSGPYSPGDIVVVTYTLSEFNVSNFNNNWIHAFQINLGVGWTNLTPITAPGNPSGTSGFWLWDLQNTYTSGFNFGPGWRFVNNSNSGWGTISEGPFTMSFEVVVGNSCINNDLSIDMSAIGDCQTGGWTPGSCCSIIPYSIYSGSASGNISVTDNPINISCNGLSDGSISLGISAGTAPYTYAWSNGAVSPVINNLPTGYYNVTVTDAVGCSETINNILISEPQALQLTTVSSNVSCNGGSDGIVTINSTSTIASYLWSDGQTTQTASNLSVGTYNYTITDINGCLFSDSVNIYEPDPLILTLNTTNESCFGSLDGTASIDIQGSSTPPGTVSTLIYCSSHPSLNTAFGINNPIIEEVILMGDNTDIIKNTVGAYDFYENYAITDYADLTEGQSYTISIILNGLGSGSPPPITNYSGAKVYIDFNIDGNFDPGEEVGVIPYRTSATIGVPDSISFTVPVTNVYGPTRMRIISQYRTDQDPTQINPCDAPNSASWAQPWYGATEDYSIVLNAPTVNATYLWSNGATTDSIYGLASGLYYVDVTDQSGCVTTANCTISSGTQITVSTSADQTICNGVVPDPLTANSSTSGVYSWVPSLDFVNPNVQNPIFLNGLASTTTYTITFVDGNGCFAIDSVTIFVSPVPTVTLSANPNPACIGDDIQLTTTTSIPVNRYRFQYNIGSLWQDLTLPMFINTNSLIFSNILTSTQFRVKVKEDWGCTPSPWSTIITVPINIISTPLISHN